MVYSKRWGKKLGPLRFYPSTEKTGGVGMKKSFPVGPGKKKTGFPETGKTDGRIVVLLWQKEGFHYFVPATKKTGGVWARIRRVCGPGKQ